MNSNTTPAASASRHTPGPWRAETNCSPFCITREIERLPKSLGGHRQFRDIAEVFVTDKGDGAPEDYANARLIAASPDILKALEVILVRASCAPHDDAEAASREFQTIVNYARAAIAKATGGKQ